MIGELQVFLLRASEALPRSGGYTAGGGYFAWRENGQWVLASLNLGRQRKDYKCES
jgi:hypothetical protein